MLRDDTKNSCVKQTIVCTELFSCMCMAVGNRKCWCLTQIDETRPYFFLHRKELYYCYYLLVYFLPCHQVKLLESLESMDKDSFNMKFGGVLTYTTVGRTCVFFTRKTLILIQICDSGILTDWPTD